MTEVQYREENDTSLQFYKIKNLIKCQASFNSEVHELSSLSTCTSKVEQRDTKIHFPTDRNAFTGLTRQNKL